MQLDRGGASAEVGICAEDIDRYNIAMAGDPVTSPSTSGSASVWRNRDFRLIWSAQGLSDLGTGVSQLAYPLLMLVLTGSPAQAGALGALRTLPYLLFGFPAGALTDRWDRKKVMILCDTGRAINMASIPLVLWAGHLTPVQLYVTAFIGGTLFVFFNAAESGCLPNVVEKEQVTSAVAAQETTSSASSVVAPPLGGSLLQIFSGLPFLVDSISYGVSVVALLSVRTKFHQGSRPQTKTRLRADIAEGIKWLWNHPIIRLVAITAAGLQLAISAIVLVVIVTARQAGIPSVAIGAILSAVGVGGVVGSIVAPRLKARVGFGWMLLGVMWLQGFLWLVLAFVSNLVVIAVILVLFAGSMPIFGVASLSYRLTATPENLLSRVGTAFRLIAWSTAPLGGAIAGLLLDNVEPTTTSLIFAVWVLGLALLASGPKGLRQLRPTTGQSPTAGQQEKDEPRTTAETVDNDR
jgi:predicted MFS family arabinose efflux permease